jgi:hypothetical protein
MPWPRSARWIRKSTRSRPSERGVTTAQSGHGGGRARSNGAVGVP